MAQLSEKQIAAFHDEGYLIVRGVFDAEEADILRAAAAADQSFKENAYDLEDGEGGKAQLVLWDSAGEDLWGAIARSDTIGYQLTVYAQSNIPGNQVYTTPEGVEHTNIGTPLAFTSYLAAGIEFSLLIGDFKPPKKKKGGKKGGGKKGGGKKGGGKKK